MSFFNHLTENKIIILLGCYVFFLLIICSHMSPLYYSNEWADVNIYFNVAKAIFNGRTLYTETFDHKGPLIFFIYGLGYLISNNSFFGMFLIQWIAWFTMVYYIYKLSKLYLDNTFAYIVAIIFPVFILKMMKAGGSAEEFIPVSYTHLDVYKRQETAWAGRDLDKSKIGYLEAHGTATTIGDKIELQTLSEVFPKEECDKNVLIGSVKSNIGHAMPAAGILGLIKTVLALYTRKIPPTLHCEQPLRGIENSRFRPVQQLQDWDENKYPLIEMCIRDRY